MDAVTVSGEVRSCLSEATLALAKIGPLEAGRGFLQNGKLWELLEIAIATTSETPGGCCVVTIPSLEGFTAPQ